VKVVVTLVAEGDQVFKLLLCIILVRAVVDVELNVITITQAAAIAVSTMYLPL
jgi:hypothetical protein